MTAKVFASCFLIVGFGSSLCAQVSPKASVSKKPTLGTKHKASRSKQYLQVSLLQGVWSDSSENNAIFWIEGKRVKFFDHIGDNTPEYQRVYWSIFNNKLSFHYSGGLVVTDDIIKLTKDSLVIYHKGSGKGRYVRLK